ncbi:MAG: glycosyltransferase family 4 protein, partial [Propionicimonas sp.]|nr:glycosyltransferase family 4 protein [Propionicimonas sp.]
GYDREACEATAAELGVTDRVRFHGRVPHDEVLGFMGRADVFVFPSYREAGGIVVTEAMSFGLPVIVVDAGGPATTVDETCGLKLPAENPEQLARDLSAAMATLAADPRLRADLGAAGRARIASLSLWSERVAFIEDLYASLGAGV